MYYVNTIQGKDGDHLGDHVDKLFRIGQKMELPDGRIFRYCSASETLVASNLQMSVLVDAGYLNENSAAHVIDLPRAIMSSTNKADVANAFQDGYYTVEDSSELGNAMFMGSHPAIASAAPTATTSSGLTPLWASLPKNCFTLS